MIFALVRETSKPAEQRADPWPNPANLAFVEGLLEEFLRDPGAVPAAWRSYFESLGAGGSSRAQLGPSFRAASLFNPPGPSLHAAPNGNGMHPLATGDGGAKGSLRAADVAALQDRVDQLVRSYRVRGHMIAKIDPLEMPRKHFHELDPEFYGFTERDLDRKFSNS